MGRRSKKNADVQGGEGLRIAVAIAQLLAAGVRLVSAFWPWDDWPFHL